MGSPSGSVGGSSSSDGASNTGGSVGGGASSGPESSGGASFSDSISVAGGGDSSPSLGEDSGGDRAQPSTSGPSADPGLTAAQSSALAESAAVMDGYALSATGSESFSERAGDAFVGTGELVGGAVVGAGERAVDIVAGLPGAAWEGVNMVNDAAGTVLDTAVGWTGLDWFEGHAARNQARGQAMVDGVLGIPDKVAEGWETFEGNWESGNYYDAGRQIGSVGLDVAAVAVPASKAGALGRINRVDDAVPNGGPRLAGAGGGDWPKSNVAHVGDDIVIRQLDEASCGPACGAMVLRDRGIDVRPTDIGTGLHSFQADMAGSLARKIEDAAPGTQWYGGHAANLGDAFGALTVEGRGSWIAELRDGTGGVSHAVVVDGLTPSGAVRIRDPWDQTTYTMTAEDFIGHWTGGFVTQ